MAQLLGTSLKAIRSFQKGWRKRIYPLRELSLEELEEIPDSAGISLEVDRLLMILLNAETIDEVVAFTPEEL